MDDSKKVLNRSSGSLTPDILFIGEAPGRLGADDTQIPFHGDQAGHNFEELIEFAGLSRQDIFVTNAVLCNPKDEKGNNSTPTKEEILKCSSFLERQIDVLKPKIIVTLGATALYSLSLIHEHRLSVKENVRTLNYWGNYKLIPLYHPGQRAMLHRSFANQRSDYQFVADALKKLYKKTKYSTVAPHTKILDIVDYILSEQQNVSYFALHKLFYLIEYRYYEKYKTKLSRAYIIRQKDGPYCTDLNIGRLKKSINISISQKASSLFISKKNSLLPDEQNDNLDEHIKNHITEVLNKYGELNDFEIKKAVYMTRPMRNILKAEKNSLINLYNTPINFASTFSSE
ncbi:MAG: uracil-DNA glycosylase family protein [Campylobacterales bacterium]|nr:uracil-DNA glycosylase family protein [Campylobacterales bacterium]